VQEVLVDCLDAKLVIVGSDFHFGHERRGNVGLLAQMGAELGFAVEGMALVDLDGAPAAEAAARVSSTAVRRALAAGELAAANEMLGRPHEVRGVVEAGGPWSADVVVPRTCQLPAEGHYAVAYERPDGAVHAGTASVGECRVSVRLVDVDDVDLTGERAKVRFLDLASREALGA
jgi:riboflavin kinase/FMN adenylyltransferase